MLNLKSLIKKVINPEKEKFGTIISFPKSGRTWVKVMLDQLSIAMEYTHAGSKYSTSCHFNELPPPSVTKTFGKQILLLRDPLDTVVSGYFQKTRRKKVNSEIITIAEFIRDPRYGVEKIARFNIAWLNHFKASGSTSHKAITYEALRADPIEGLKALYIHLKGCPPRTSRIIEDVVEEASFARMQAKERSGELATKYGSVLRPGDINDPESFKVRRGEVSGYFNYLSADDISYCGQVLDRLNYHGILHECRDVMLMEA